MTTQTADVLILRGNQYPFRPLSGPYWPLEVYIRRLRKTQRVDIATESTACYRCHIALWEITGGALYLVDLITHAFIDDKATMADIKMVFPWLKPPVKATWVTDELTAQEGRMIHYNHMAAHNGFERDRLFYIERGEVREERLRINPPDPVIYQINPVDGSRSLIGEDRELLSDPLAADQEPEGYHFWPKASVAAEFDIVVDGTERLWPTTYP